jgi:hypothetical protein
VTSDENHYPVSYHTPGIPYSITPAFMQNQEVENWLRAGGGASGSSSISKNKTRNVASGTEWLSR